MRGLALVLGLAALPASAQDSPDPAPPAAPDSQMDQGMSLLQEGAQLLLRGLLSEVEPQMQQMGRSLDTLGRDLGAAMERFGPMIAELSVMVDDIRNYEAPERLPNGDIIIRRKALPETPPGGPQTGPEIEL